MAWLVVVYLGSLAALFLTAFYQIDDFTGQVVQTFTLKNFTTLFTTTAYYQSVLRTISIALLVTVLCLVIALGSFSLSFLQFTSLCSKFTHQRYLCLAQTFIFDTFLCLESVILGGLVSHQACRI